jgi:hypothetical protein
MQVALPPGLLVASVQATDVSARSPTADLVIGHDTSQMTRMIQLGDVYDLLPVPTVILGPQGRCLEVSKKFCDEFGITKNECLQINFTDLVHSKFHDYGILSLLHLIDQASRTSSSLKSNPISSTVGEPWVVQIDPISRDTTLLGLQLLFQRAPSSLIAGASLRTIQTGHAFRILVETVKDYAIL